MDLKEYFNVQDPKTGETFGEFVLRTDMSAAAIARGVEWAAYLEKRDAEPKQENRTLAYTR